MIEVTGIEKVINQLQSIKKTKAKSAIRKGSRVGAKIIQERAKQLAPKGKTGRLEANIKVRALPRSRKWVGVMVALKWYIAAFLEYGTKYIKPRHYLKKATEQVQSAARSAAIEQMKRELEQ